MSEKILNILLIEDNPGDARLVQELLRNLKILSHLTHVDRLSSAEAHSSTQFDLILLDLHLPDSSGLETVIKTTKIFDQTPIIVFTSQDNEEISLASIQAGAQDYLVKHQITAKTLEKTIKYALQRFQTIRKIHASIAKQRAYFATHDTITGLANEKLLIDNMDLIISKRELTKITFALFLIEIHEINKIKEHFGHENRSSALALIAKNLKAALNNQPFVARYNDNTFAILYTEITHPSVLPEAIATIQQVIKTALTLTDQEFLPSFSMGIAIFPYDGETSELLIKSANTALQKAKQKGINQYEFHMKEGSLSSLENNLIWYSDIDNALKRGELFIVYQPQYDTITHKILGVEALVRWKHPQKGIIFPDAFIPIAEDSHIILALGKWILESVIKQFKDWQNQLSTLLDLRISINVSVFQLHDPSFVTNLQDLLQKYQIPPHLVILELTESAFISEAEEIIEKLNHLKRIGVQLAIDDFGRGFSSFFYLSHLPINFIKLDTEFIKTNVAHSSTYEIVRSIITLAHNLNYKVIAEGVETKEQLSSLESQQCDEFQGYYFCEPISAEAIFTLIKKS